jgi:hypothetical protein
MTGQQPSSPATLRVTDLNPYLSFALLQCEADDEAMAFRALVRFVKETLSRVGQATSVRVVGEALHTGDDVLDGLGQLDELGFDALFAIVRERVGKPSWAAPKIEIADVTNELTLVLRRGGLVALRTTIADQVLRTWTRQATTPFRLVPAAVLSGTFPGDSTAVWLQGVHPRRPGKADGKMFSGVRTQELVNPIDDSTSVMSAARVSYLPTDRKAVLRGTLVTNSRSRIAWTTHLDLPTYLAATAELLEHVDRALTGVHPLVTLFPELCVPETDLTVVSGAFDVGVALAGVTALDQDVDAGSDLLREHLLDVHGDPSSAAFLIDVGSGGSVAGVLDVRPVRRRDGVELVVTAPGGTNALVADVAEAIGDGDLLTVYYESGHAINAGRLYRQNLGLIPPFPHLEFRDFTGYRVEQEKPAATAPQAIHDAIGRNGDDSLFAWVVAEFDDGWLLCDDGPGEVADFLHLDGHGTLRAIHVKGANSASPRRGGRRHAVRGGGQSGGEERPQARQRRAGRAVEHTVTHGQARDLV